MTKPKSKTEKKIDNNIRTALTDICTQSQKTIPGFAWLTHQANYTNFPASLFITCVFNTENEKNIALNNGSKTTIEKNIQAKLLKAGIKFKALGKQVAFDSEQACAACHQGDWGKRLACNTARAVPKNRPH
ncbi:hypothetical protein [Teredinibacter purpureus]|uniref:hypothetical protein n=1 Tax=Teredinibacter purpureus TaxID=2731756 RepID=UPI0005F7C47A|nr:hypothetical protein [Teredinibacter purpureus]